MKFHITTAGRYYTESQAEKLEKLGFKFTFKPNNLIFNPRKYLINKDIEINNVVEINIATLDELVLFSNEWGSIIISDGKIEIYDDYRE